MKITALVTAAALACGSAFAAQDNTASNKDAKPAAAAEASGKTHEGIGVKTKRVFKKMGDKLRSTGNQLARSTKTDKGGANDTRTMGGARSDAQKKQKD